MNLVKNDRKIEMNKKNRTLNWLTFTIFTVFTATAVLTGCSKSPESSGQTADSQTEQDYYIIGISMPTTRLAYRKAMKELVEDTYLVESSFQTERTEPSSSAAAEYSSASAGSHPRVKIRIYDADGSQKQQNQDILEMVDAGVDGIVLVPNTMEGCLSSVEYANTLGVPVITVDNRIRNSSSAQVVSFVGADHYSMGQDAAKLFLQILETHLPEKETWNVIHLTGIPDSSGTIDRGQAIADTLAQSGRIRLLGTYDGEFTVVNAASVMEDCLEIFEEIDGVICQNDNMAEGCYQALRKAGKAGSIVVVGIDGQQSTLEIMAEGGIHGTVLQHPSMILDGIEYLCDYLDGKPLAETYFEPTDLVNEENVSYYLQHDLSW